MKFLLGLSLVCFTLAVAGSAGGASTGAQVGTCQATFQITKTERLPGTTNVHLGLRISGTACTGERLLFFDQTEGGKLHRDNDVAVSVRHARWSFDSTPVGEKVDPVGTTYRVYAVRATAACIAAVRSGSADISALPSSCPNHKGRSWVRFVQIQKVRP